jgi:predicted nucleic acid-binding Zn finger protein
MKTLKLETEFIAVTGLFYVKKGEFSVEMCQENIEGLFEVLQNKPSYVLSVAYTSASRPEINIVKLSNEVLISVETEKISYMKFTMQECWEVLKESKKYTLASETEFM